jgi:hypothetical protein
MGVVAEGGYGVGVNPEGVYFPFIKEVSGAERLFADMYLGHYKADAVLPLRITDISGFTQPATNPASMKIVDALAESVFDSDDADYYRYKDWGTRFRIHEWGTADAVLRVVQHTGQNDSEDVITYPSSQTLSDAVLDERVSELWPEGLRAIVVNNQMIYNDVEFVSGYNFSTNLDSTVLTDGQAKVNSITVSAEAGKGEGQTPGCPESSAGPGATTTIKRINQTEPNDKGAFHMTFNDCFNLCKPGTTSNFGEVKKITFEDPNSVLVNNSCLPCCSCDDFVYTYRAIRKLYDKYKKLGARAVKTRDTHSDNIVRWLGQKNCRESSPVKLSLIPYKMQDDSCVKVAMGICNSFEVCRGEFAVHLNFTGPSGLKGYINPNSVFAYDPSGYGADNYVLEGTWPNMIARWPVVDSQSLAKLKFDMSFSRDPKVVWDGSFSLLDGPAGNVVMEGRYSVVFQDVGLKTLYTVVGTVLWTDAKSTLKQGLKVVKVADKIYAENVPVANFMNNTYTSLGNWSWTVIHEPTSITVKPYTLHLNFDHTGNWYAKDEKGKNKLVYSGRLYADTKIVPTFVSKVSDGDYVTVDIDAKLNGTTIAHGTLSETVGLKVSE